jgi:hypothetical protein
MPRTPRPFVMTLTPQEAAELQRPSGRGGHQTLHTKLRAQLAAGNLTVTLTDDELGFLIRYMTQYRSGGFQSRLKRAFRRPLRVILNL